MPKAFAATEVFREFPEVGSHFFAHQILGAVIKFVTKRGHKFEDNPLELNGKIWNQRC